MMTEYQRNTGFVFGTEGVVVVNEKCSVFIIIAVNVVREIKVVVGSLYNGIIDNSSRNCNPADDIGVELE